jgi:hypothetical protein
MSETSPVGVPLPDPGETSTEKLIGCPCVNVMGLVGGLVESVSAIFEGVKFEVHLLTKLATLTEPNPVAKS